MKPDERGAKQIMSGYEYIIPCAIAFIVSFFASPIAKKIAVRLNAIDVPEDDRRMHKKPIPRMGGLAVIAGFLVSSIYIFLVYEPVELVSWLEEVSSAKVWGFFIGMLIIIALGVYVDIHPLSAKIMFPIQLIAAAIVVFSGTQIKFITISISDVRYVSVGNTLSIILSIVWIAGITNAINLIDGLDGLSAGVSGIASISLFFVSVMMAPDVHIIFSVLYIALAGAILGFLPFNFNPAKIFMVPQCLFSGLHVSVISIEGATKAYTALTMVVSLIALACL